jgi:hypothetical protein
MTPIDGIVALSQAASSLSRSGGDYEQLLRGLDSIIYPQIERRAARLPRAKPGMAAGEFDAIGGITGLAILPLKGCRRFGEHRRLG